MQWRVGVAAMVAIARYMNVADLRGSTSSVRCRASGVGRLVAAQTQQRLDSTGPGSEDTPRTHAHAGTHAATGERGHIRLGDRTARSNRIAEISQL